MRDRETQIQFDQISLENAKDNIKIWWILFGISFLALITGIYAACATNLWITGYFLGSDVVMLIFTMSELHMSYFNKKHFAKMIQLRTQLFMNESSLSSYRENKLPESVLREAGKLSE